MIMLWNKQRENLSKKSMHKKLVKEKHIPKGGCSPVIEYYPLLMKSWMIYIQRRRHCAWKVPNMKQDTGYRIPNTIKNRFSRSSQLSSELSAEAAQQAESSHSLTLLSLMLEQFGSWQVTSADITQVDWSCPWHHTSLQSSLAGGCVIAGSTLSTWLELFLQRVQ